MFVNKKYYELIILINQLTMHRKLDEENIRKLQRQIDELKERNKH